MSKPMSRDERIRAVLAEAFARADEQAARERAAYMKASGGLPFPALRARGGGSIVNRSPGRRTTGKHHTH